MDAWAVLEEDYHDREAAMARLVEELTCRCNRLAREAEEKDARLADFEEKALENEQYKTLWQLQERTITAQQERVAAASADQRDAERQSREDAAVIDDLRRRLGASEVVVLEQAAAIRQLQKDADGAAVAYDALADHAAGLRATNATLSERVRVLEERVEAFEAEDIGAFFARRGKADTAAARAALQKASDGKGPVHNAGPQHCVPSASSQAPAHTVTLRTFEHAAAIGDPPAHGRYPPGASLASVPASALCSPDRAESAPTAAASAAAAALPAAPPSGPAALFGSFDVLDTKLTPQRSPSEGYRPTSEWHRRNPDIPPPQRNTVFSSDDSDGDGDGEPRRAAAPVPLPAAAAAGSTFQTVRQRRQLARGTIGASVD